MWFDRFRSTQESTRAVDVAPSYQSRATRFALDVPLSFVEEERRYEGQCINVSESGILARFADPPEVWTNGKVELNTGVHYLDIHARVARIENDAIGFAFCLNTPNDCEAIEILLNFVSGRLPVGLSATRTAEKDDPAVIHKQ